MISAWQLKNIIYSVINNLFIFAVLLYGADFSLKNSRVIWNYPLNFNCIQFSPKFIAFKLTNLLLLWLSTMYFRLQAIIVHEQKITFTQWHSCLLRLCECKKKFRCIMALNAHMMQRMHTHCENIIWSTFKMVQIGFDFISFRLWLATQFLHACFE